MASIYSCRLKDGGETFRVRYRMSGRSCSTTFSSRADAQKFAAMIDVMGAAAARQSVGIDDSGEPRRDPVWLNPDGCYVYILWGEDGPIYVGQSANALMRLNAHMRDTTKRGLTTRIQLVECGDEGEMNEMEARLIRKYLPSMNVAGMPKRALARRAVA